jgi:hypothetical protein
VHARAITRLLRQGAGRFAGGSVHETLEVTGRVALLGPGVLLHFRDLTLAEDALKNERYAGLKARDAGPRRGFAAWWNILAKPPAKFLKIWLGQRFILCGVPGLIVSAQLAQYVFMTEAIRYRLGREDTPEAREAGAPRTPPE